ncbi:uncharacterized protein LOC143289560 [Babylonia areolata]|uniref:uncharacterized protein LOC143289560 n=1 Tax=Babylonia areolata TaxID=304850 RepID=UPI003FCF73B3
MNGHIAGRSSARSRPTMTFPTHVTVMAAVLLLPLCLGVSSEANTIQQQQSPEKENTFDFAEVDTDGSGCVQGPEEKQKFRLYIGDILKDSLKMSDVERALQAGRITHSADINKDGKICECDLLTIFLTDSTGDGRRRHAFRVFEDGSIFDGVDGDGDGYLADVTEKEGMTRKLAQCVSDVKARTIVEAMSKLERDDGRLARTEYMLFLNSPHHIPPNPRPQMVFPSPLRPSASMAVTSGLRNPSIPRQRGPPRHHQNGDNRPLLPPRPVPPSKPVPAPKPVQKPPPSTVQSNVRPVQTSRPILTLRPESVKPVQNGFRPVQSGTGPALPPRPVQTSRPVFTPQPESAQPSENRVQLAQSISRPVFPPRPVQTSRPVFLPKQVQTNTRPVQNGPRPVSPPRPVPPSRPEPVQMGPKQVEGKPEPERLLPPQSMLLSDGTRVTFPQLPLSEDLEQPRPVVQVNTLNQPEPALQSNALGQKPESSAQTNAPSQPKPPIQLNAFSQPSPAVQSNPNSQPEPMIQTNAVDPPNSASPRLPPYHQPKQQSFASRPSGPKIQLDLENQLNPLSHPRPGNRRNQFRHTSSWGQGNADNRYNRVRITDRTNRPVFVRMTLERNENRAGPSRSRPEQPAFSSAGTGNQAPQSMNRPALSDIRTVRLRQPVNPDTIRPRQPVNPDTIRPRQPVNPDTIRPRQPVNPDTIRPRQPVNPDTIRPRQPVNPDTIRPRQPVNPDTIRPRQPVNPDTIRPRQPVNPDTIRPRQPVNPDTALERQLQRVPQRQKLPRDEISRKIYFLIQQSRQKDTGENHRPRSQSKERTNIVQPNHISQSNRQPVPVKNDVHNQPRQNNWNRFQNEELNHLPPFQSNSAPAQQSVRTPSRIPPSSSWIAQMLDASQRQPSRLAKKDMEKTTKPRNEQPPGIIRLPASIPAQERDGAQRRTGQPHPEPVPVNEAVGNQPNPQPGRLKPQKKKKKNDQQGKADNSSFHATA